MKISVKKTEAMVLSRTPTSCILHVDGTQLPVVDEFKYLGVKFTSDGRQDKEIDRRIAQASIVARELWKMVMCNSKLSRDAKLTIFRSLYRSTLTYGHEAWILNQRTRSRIQAAEMRFLRRIVGVTRMDRIRNEDIRQDLGVEALLLTVEKSQMRWLGHVLRMAPDRLARMALDAVPDGRRPVGRPRTRWQDQALQICERAGVRPADAKTTAQDRTTWRHLATYLTPRPI